MVVSYPLVRGAGGNLCKPTFASDIMNNMLPVMVIKALKILSSNIEETAKIIEVARLL